MILKRLSAEKHYSSYNTIFMFLTIRWFTFEFLLLQNRIKNIGSEHENCRFDLITLPVAFSVIIFPKKTLSYTNGTFHIQQITKYKKITEYIKQK